MVPTENKTVSYSGIDDVARMALHLGSPNWAMRIDIKHTFKCLPLTPSQRHLTGFSFRGAFFIQTQMPFGASASCLHFEKAARFLRWIIQNEHPPALITNYLDDFWITQKLKDELAQLANIFTQIIEQEIGFPINHNKTLGASNDAGFCRPHCRLNQPASFVARRQKTKFIKHNQYKLLSAHAEGKLVKVKDLERCTGILNYVCQGKNRMSKGQLRAICLFKEVCDRQNFPLELKEPQL